MKYFASLQWGFFLKEIICSLWEQILSFKNNPYFGSDSRHSFQDFSLQCVRIIPLWLRHCITSHLNFQAFWPSAHFAFFVCMPYFLIVMLGHCCFVLWPPRWERENWILWFVEYCAASKSPCAPSSFDNDDHITDQDLRCQQVSKC